MEEGMAPCTSGLTPPFSTVISMAYSRQLLVEDDRRYDIQIATIPKRHCYHCHTYLSSSTRSTRHKKSRVHAGPLTT
jgi:hypothetical protein